VGNFLPSSERGVRNQDGSRLERRNSGVGYVTRFRVRKTFLDRYDVHQVDGQTVLQYWIPAADVDEPNSNIVGKIEVVAEYR
jgi:hypothetical protein